MGIDSDDIVVCAMADTVADWVEEMAFAIIAGNVSEIKHTKEQFALALIELLKETGR